MGVLLLGCVLLLFIWWQIRWHEGRVKVSNCLHDNMSTEQLDKSLGLTLLVRCRDCGWQSHIRNLEPLPDGSYWWLENRSDSEERYFQKIREIREQMYSE